ncbi:TetR/AcrR family transcriptional regulator [Nocardia asteroides]|uniref:TetR/AcrR family transcriptional regulator n=1 Tax=Nocardia asteroides TaxID=1824 RepID=UPI0033C97395
MATREEQKQATRARILEAATDLLVERGYAALTTVAVQEAAGLSRGALLHHFPTIGALTTALVQNLVARNERAALAAAERFGADADPVDRALAALYDSMTQPAAQAELELWSAARTDPDLAAALRRAERAAGRDLLRVVDGVFGPEVVTHPRYPVIRDLTITVLRGTATGRVLHTSETSARATLRAWADIVRSLLG